MKFLQNVENLIRKLFLPAYNNQILHTEAEIYGSVPIIRLANWYWPILDYYYYRYQQTFDITANVFNDSAEWSESGLKPGRVIYVMFCADQPGLTQIDCTI